MLYVLGQARERQDVVAAEIAHDKNAPIFLISTQTEKQVTSGYGRWFWVLLVLGLICAIGGAVGKDLLASSDRGLSWQPFVEASLGFLAMLTICWVWTVYNSLINLHHRLEQGWSQVDVQLKRRHDLIPSLVTAVAGYRDYESETQKTHLGAAGSGGGDAAGRGWSRLQRYSADVTGYNRALSGLESQ